MASSGWRLYNIDLIIKITQMKIGKMVNVKLGNKIMRKRCNVPYARAWDKDTSEENKEHYRDRLSQILKMNG